MANSFTTYYNLTKPEVGADTNAWGGHLNGDLDVIDSTMKSISDTASAALPKAGGTMTGNITFAAGQPTATTSAPSIVQLTDSTSSTSTTTAATPNSVKSAYDLANAAVPKAGGTMTGLLVLSADPSANLNPATKQYVDLRALKATTITAGTGLTGGGDLSANRTIGISAGGVSATELASDAVTTAKILNANVTPAKLSQPLTAGTAVATTSGTSVSFTSIPSWVKRITIMLSNVSANASAYFRVQIGTGGTATTSGYTSSAWTVYSQASGGSAGFYLNGGAAPAVTQYSGHVVITNVSGNTWVYSSVIADTYGTGTGNYSSVGGGFVTLAGVLDMVRFDASGNTLDSGSVNILYE